MAVPPTFPRVQAMVVCDEIHEHEWEDAVDLLGVRAAISPARFPHVQAQLGVYAQVSGRPGSVSCHLVIIEADAEEPLVITPEQDV